jgi:hypothetical protein
MATGAQEVPTPVLTRATATLRVTIKSDRFFLYKLGVDSIANDVDGNIIAAHLHHGLPGQNGPVVLSLIADGAFHSVDNALSTVTGLITGEIYMNVHTSIYPGGLVRGQVKYAPAATAISNFVCGAILQVASPGHFYLLNYPNMHTCSITLETPGPLLLNFYQFETEASYDFVSLYDDSTLVWKKSGALQPFTYSANSNRLQITFASDYSYSSLGFAFNWTANSGTNLISSMFESTK